VPRATAAERLKDLPVARTNYARRGVSAREFQAGLSAYRRRDLRRKLDVTARVVGCIDRSGCVCALPCTPLRLGRRLKSESPPRGRDIGVGGRDVPESLIEKSHRKPLFEPGARGAPEHAPSNPYASPTMGAGGSAG
jgi:hypothetical protein